MRKLLIVAVLGAVVVVVVGGFAAVKTGLVGGPRIDATTDETLRASIGKVKDALPEAQRPEFEKALQVLAFAGVSSFADLAKYADKPDGLKDEMKKRLHGKNAQEVLAEARKVKAEREVKERAENAAREAKEREHKLAKIEELRKKLSKAQADRAELAKFRIDVLRFRYVESGFRHEGQIELGVTNQLGKTAARVYFESELLTPSRDVPWVKDDFNYQIPGGLQNGEKATWGLRPNMFGSFSNAPRDRYDLVFIAFVTRIDGPDGAILDDTFPKTDVESLASLVDEVGYAERAEVKAMLALRASEETTRRTAAIKAQIEAELAALMAKKDDAEKGAAVYKRFVIRQARFRWEKTRYSEDPVIEVAAENKTGFVISTVHAFGIVSAPDRELPLLRAEFNFGIRGGLKDGDAGEYSLKPNMFSDWGKLPKNRDDLVMTVTVQRLDGADDKPIVSLAQLTESEQKRLDWLSSIQHPFPK